MSSNIVDKSFYLTSIFASIKSDHRWTTNETKMVLLLFKKLSEYKIFLPDLDSFDDSRKELNERIKKIPIKYTFNKKEFQLITGIKQEHLAREIKKVSKGLLSKVIITPHPLNPDDTNSFKAFTWFTDIEYVSSEGIIKMKVNDSAIERLVAFVKYSHINFENIIKIQNHNAIHTYLIFKILIDSAYAKELTITLEEYKSKLGLDNRYRNFSEFRKYVLDIVKKEINESTDIDLSYKLIKEGRAYTKVKFEFDYKERNIISNKPSNTSEFSDELDNSESYFEAILTSWGIRAKKVVEIEESYSINAINEAIEVTKLALENNDIKTTPAAFFIGTLENKELQSQAEFERQQQIIREQQEKEYQKQLASEYDAIQKFINDNEDELSKYLSAKSLNIEYPLNDSIIEQVANLACVDAEKFKAFRPKLSVLHEGYFDMKQKKEIRPNMYSFLNILKA